MDNLASQLIDKVPLFFGFSPQQMQVFLDICMESSRTRGEIFCEYGEPSDALFILLNGQLGIAGQDGTVLAHIFPVTTVGEMGFITRKPRSAIVWAMRASRLLEIQYHDFEALVKQDFELGAKIYRNMVGILADRLSDANDLIFRYRKLYESEQEPPDTGDDEELAQQTESSEEEDRVAAALIRRFYEYIGRQVCIAQIEVDKKVFDQLMAEGYSEADIEYAIKWTVRNLPSSRDFEVVKSSIGDAFETRWST